MKEAGLASSAAPPRETATQDAHLTNHLTNCSLLD
jgi:hypothetical protein